MASLSSPPASLQEEHHQEPNIASFNHEGSPRSTTSSVWTAPSPSQLEQSTSPTLPQGPRLVGEPRTPVSSGRHQRTSSVYYTASWGSPYQPPELSSDKATQGSLTRFKNTEDLEEPSPVPQLRFKYLLSTNQSPEGAPAASTSRTRRKAHASKKVTRSFGPIPANQEVKKPDRSSTEDWIRQYLSGQSNSERGNWWSDDSGGSETRTEARSPKRLARVNIEDWLDPEDEGNLQGEAGNPKFQTDFIRRQESARATPASLHKTREQGEGNSGFYEPDTGDIFGYPQELKNKGNYMAEATLSSKFASPYPTPMEEIDLNLPGPTADEPNTKSASSMDKSAPLPPSTPVGNKGADLLSPDVSSTPAKSTTQPNFSSPARTGQRPKKRTVWRGRNCVIALPLDETRGKPGGAPPPLTHEEDDERLRAWESEGFDTSSFKLATAGESQSRGVYPGSEDERSERKQGKYSVSIPDRRSK